MTDKRPHDQEFIVVNFLERLLQDRASSCSRPLKEYQAMYPGHEEVIAAAFARACNPEMPGFESQENAVTVHEIVAPGQVFSHYRVERELGRGGQGIVFLARDTRLDRHVALKVLYGLSLLSSAALKRLKQEAGIAAMLHHPCICTVFDTGVERGVPYLAMQYLEGETLARILERRRDVGREHPGPPPPDAKEMDEILDILIKVGEGLHVAHEAGVLHRDIKPGNIMLTADSHPYILDFGLGREVEKLQETITATGISCGTPAYMSPEQLVLEKTELDRRTDIYSLGVVLYEGLTHDRPHSETETVGLKKVQHLPPPRNPRRLNPLIDRNLHAVLEKALASDRRERYPTMQALVEDLRRLREKKSVDMKPAGVVRRFHRWVRRSPVVAGFTLTILLILFVGLLVFAYLYVETEEARKKSVWREYHAKITAISEMLGAGRLREARQNLPTCPRGHRGWEHQYLTHLTDTSLSAVPPTDSHVVCMALDPEANSLLCVTGSGALKEYDAGQYVIRENRKAPVFPGKILPYHAAASPGGAWIVTSHKEKKTCTVRIWDGASLKPRFHLPWKKPGSGITRLAISSDGRRVLISADQNRSLYLWSPDAGTDQKVCEIELDIKWKKLVRFSPIGNLAAVAGARSFGSGEVVILLDTDTLKDIGRLDEHGPGIQAMTFSSDGRRLATAVGSTKDPGRDKILLWDTRKSRILARIDNPHSAATCLALAPDDAVLATGHQDGRIQIFDGGLQRKLRILTGHAHEVTDIQFGPQGRFLHAGTKKGSLRVWDVRCDSSALFLETAPDALDTLAFGPSGNRLACGAWHGYLTIFDLIAGRLQSLHAVPNHTHLAFSRNGCAILFWGYYAGKPSYRYDLLGKKYTPMFPDDLGEDAYCVTFDPDRNRLLYCRESTLKVEVFSCIDRTAILKLDGLHSVPLFLAINQGGNRIAALSQDSRATVWDLPGTIGNDTDLLIGIPTCLALSPDGKWLAAGNGDGDLKILPLEGQACPTSPLQFEGRIRALAFSPDSRRLAVGVGRKVLLLEPKSGSCLLVLGPLVNEVKSLSFSPNGRRLAAGCMAGGIHVWNTPGIQVRPETPSDGSTSEKAHEILDRVAAEYPGPGKVLSILESRLNSPGTDTDAVKMAHAMARIRLRRSSPHNIERRIHGLLENAGCPAAWYGWALSSSERELRDECTGPYFRTIHLRNKIGALFFLGRYHEALDTIKNVKQMHPDIQRFRALCLLHTGQREQAMKTDPHCIRWLEKHDSDRPDDSWYDFHARRVALEPGLSEEKYRKALDWARLACDRCKGPAYREGLGLLQFWLGRYADVLETLSFLSRDSGENPTLAQAVQAAASCLHHQASGNETEAWASYNRLVVLRNSFDLCKVPAVLALFKKVKQAGPWK